MCSPRLAAGSPQGTRPHSGATNLEDAWSHALSGDSSPVCGDPLGSLPLPCLAFGFATNGALLFQSRVAQALPRQQGGSSAAREENLTVHCLRAGLLGMQGQRCPVGVTAVPELRPPDTKPGQHWQVQTQQPVGSGGVLEENSSST